MPEGFALLDDILRNPALIAPPRVAVPLLAWHGRGSMLSGREKSGKTTLAAFAASRKSTGGAILGADVEPGPVLWVGLEEHVGEVAARFQRFGADPENIMLTTHRPANVFADVARAAAAFKPALIVLDNLGQAAREIVETPNDQRWLGVMAALMEIPRDTDAGLLILHHASKAGSYLNSVHIGAGVDAILELTRDEREQWTRNITAQGRFQMERNFSVRLLESENLFELASEELSMDARLLAFVNRHPGCTTKQTLDGVAGRDKTKHETLRRLIAGGAVVNRGTERAHSLFSGNGAGNAESAALFPFVSIGETGGKRSGNVTGNGSVSPAPSSVRRAGKDTGDSLPGEADL